MTYLQLQFEFEKSQLIECKSDIQKNYQLGYAKGYGDALIHVSNTFGIHFDFLYESGEKHDS